MFITWAYGRRVKTSCIVWITATQNVRIGPRRKGPPPIKGSRTTNCFGWRLSIRPSYWKWPSHFGTLPTRNWGHHNRYSRRCGICPLEKEHIKGGSKSGRMFDIPTWSHDTIGQEHSNDLILCVRSLGALYLVLPPEATLGENRAEWQETSHSYWLAM